MSLLDLQLTQNVLDVHVNTNLGTISALTENTIQIFSYTAKKGKSTTERLAEVSITIECGTPRQVVLSNKRQLFVLCNTIQQQGQIYFTELTGQKDTITPDDVLPQEHSTSSLGITLDGEIFYNTDFSATINAYGEGITTEPSFSFKFGKYCAWTEVSVVGETIVPFGLTRSGTLYAKHQVIAQNCTSFLVTSAHLIYTTSQHLLKFVHLSSADVFEVPADEPEKDERCRSIERGAKLVTAIPSAYSLVLQMPRGNLETIYPRAMVLAGIRKSLDKLDYKTTFFACRAHRVDMNIIHDYNPPVFMQNIDKFVDQIQKVEHIDLFLSQLKEEDVTETMYKDTIKLNHTVPTAEISTGILEQKHSKINAICEAFLTVLEPRAATNLQNMITSHVCKSPPDLDGGLTIIVKLFAADQEVAEKAAEHICFLADPNQLYEHALGIYDLDVALLIAQQSQKDPREYLPYMQKLQECSLGRRKFTIDDDLNRHEKALVHLHDLNEFDELKTYTQKHNLYKSALALYKYQQDKLNGLMKLYANNLNESRSFKEAGIAYEYLADYVSATDSYRQGNMWQEALYCAEIAQWPTEKVKVLAEELAQNLEESKEHLAAASIYRDYLDDIHSAAAALCRAYQFAEATRTVILRNKPELLESVVDAGLSESFSTTVELLADCKSQLQAQVPRLRDLRLKKLQEPLAFYAGDPSANADGDFPDDVSLAPTDASTSGGTFMTRYTGHTNGTLNTQTSRRTSKVKRREERKRARGKKGSVYEEEYLVNSIGRLIERLNTVNDDVKSLVEGLVKRRMREQARAVDDAMDEVLRMIKAVLDEVYETPSGNSAQQPNGESVPTGGDAVLHDAMVASQAPKVAPVIKTFETLTLAG
jgi:elongator complex protein 1